MSPLPHSWGDGPSNEARTGEHSPPARVSLGPLTGWDELNLSPADPGAPLTLLGRLVGDDQEYQALRDLPVSDIDRLLARVYRSLYGDSAECRVACSACGEAYEFTLSLQALTASQDAQRPGPPDADGCWRLADGRRVRAPRPADLEAAQGTDALLAQLVVQGDPADDPEQAIGFLERAAPVLSLDLDAPCPHCGSAETARFDLSRYMIQRLAGERPFLLREAHLIASRYGWSHAEIMSLPRDDRRAYAGLIEAERAAGQRRRAVS